MKTPSDHQSKRSPSSIEHVVAAVMTLLVLEQHSRMPEVSFFVFFLSAIAVLALGIAYLKRLRTALLRRSDTQNTKLRAYANWVVLPLTVALMMTSSATHWPATIRFYLSKPSFDYMVAEAQRGVKPTGFPRWVGLYRIEYVRDSEFDYETRKGTIGFVTGVALIDDCGLSYDETDRWSSHYLTTRIAPNWYVTEW